MNGDAVKKLIWRYVTKLLFRAPDIEKDANRTVPVSQCRLTLDPEVYSQVAPFLPVAKQTRATFDDIFSGLDCSITIYYFDILRLDERVADWGDRFFQLLIPRLAITRKMIGLYLCSRGKTRDAIWYLEYWYRNHYHWLICQLAKLVECRDVLDGDLAKTIDLANSEVRVSSLAAFDFKPDQMLTVAGTWIGKLAYVQRTGIPIQGILKIRSTFSATINESVLPKRIYITRETNHYRFITNEKELRAFLHNRGFTFVEFDGLSLAEQARMVSNAEIIVGAHGAGLTNVIFAPAGSRLIELCPDCLNDPSYFVLCMICGLNYTRLAATTKLPENPPFSDLEVDLEQLDIILHTVVDPVTSNIHFFHVPTSAARVELV